MRGRIDWKYALCLELDDPGFDYSVLSEFRARLLAGGAEALLFERLLARCREAGLLKARGRQRTDSTVVLAAVRALNRLEFVGETLRHALNSLAVAAPAWLREVPAVETLRRVWVQQFHAAEGAVRWRATTELPPAAVLINSPYDPEARFSKKRDVSWTGYKAHLTETCDPDTPHLTSHVETTAATTQDSDVTATIHTALAAKGLLPEEHLLDEGYIDAAHLVTSRDEHGVALVGPVARDGSWQAVEGQGFEASRFAVDWAAQRVHCPQGQLSRKWQPTHDGFGNPVIHVAWT